MTLYNLSKYVGFGFFTFSFAPPLLCAKQDITHSLITLAYKIAFDLKRYDHKLVSKNYKVDFLGIACPYFFHYGKNIFVTYIKKFFITSAVKFVYYFQ
mgnify:CR=1